MRLIDFKQYLTSFITVTLLDGTAHSGFVSNAEAFYKLPNDAEDIPDIRLMNGLMSDIIHFDEIDYVENADREDTLSLKMLLTEQPKSEEIQKPRNEESDFEKMMASLKRLVVKGKDDRPRITKAVLLSRPHPERETTVRQHLTITEHGEITLVSYSHRSGETTTKNATIEETAAEDILNLLYDASTDNETATQGGSFRLVLSVNGYEDIRIYGPLNGSATANEIRLTPYLRERIPLDNLILFG